jgi:hypothetical protein
MAKWTRALNRLEKQASRFMTVKRTGNVKTREMAAFNKQYSCRFKLTPVQ